MRAKIKLWGNEYLALSVAWLKDGNISHVVIADEAEAKVIFQKANHISGLDAENNRHADELIYANLNEIIEWVEV